MRRSAFTFIELVFSIVVVGLVILSIPLIVRQSNANTIESQNVIGYYNALTLMNVIRNKPWDLGNVNGTLDNFTAAGGYYILNTDIATLNCRVLDTSKPNLISKPGLAVSDRRRMCDPNATTARPITGSGDLNNISAFNGYKQNISFGNNTFFTLEVSVRYVNVDFGNNTTAGSIVNAGSNSSYVKEIQVQLYRQIDGANELVSVYKYYAANIGTDVPFAKDNQ